MAIRQSLLNKLVNIYKFQNTISSTGDVSNAKVAVQYNVKCRITNNRVIDRGNILGVSGIISSSSHVMFCNVGTLIEVGYLVLDGTREFRIDFVIKEPGGALNSHYEVYLSLSDTENLS